MRLGIDFGTTRIVAAAVDRGNYPVVTFEDADGSSREWFPPLIAARGNERVYGWQAWAAQDEPGWTIVRSIKRVLQDSGPHTDVHLGDVVVPVIQVLTEMVEALGVALRENSSLPAPEGDLLEVMLGVPATANSNQRFLTVEPFVRAGFQVLGLLNEPSAASIEYGHRSRTSGESELLLVYDLGGGTFDASLVRIDDRTHTVVATEGLGDVGGDDFDLVLSEMALECAGISPCELSQAELFRLHEECRAKKEALHPNTRRVVVDLSLVREGVEPAVVPASDYYERCRPLIERSILATEQLLAQHDQGQRVDALYVTGGGSELPMVARMLREVFGRRVKRSAYTRSATAIGLAIQADAQAGYVLRESFHRNFGVWREWDSGRSVAFDPLFAKGTPLPSVGEAPLEIARSYPPVHNIGHFRYIECSHTTADGLPAGDIALWDEIRFPFDPCLSDRDELASVPVTRSRGGEQVIEESYTVNRTGIVEVRISNLTTGYSRTYKLARWAAKSEPIVPGRRKRSLAEAR